MSKKFVDRAIDDIEFGLNKQEAYFNQWAKVDEVLAGNYILPSMEDMQPVDDGAALDNLFFVKSELLYRKKKELLSILSMPSDFSFICQGVSETDSMDSESAIMAKSILEYYWRTQKHSKIYRRWISDVINYNKGFVRAEFKDAKAGEVGNTTDIFGALYSGGRFMPGFAYLQNIRPQDVVIADGFSTIDEAMDEGGWIAIRSYALTEWVKKNEKYNKKARAKIKEGDSQKPRNNEGKDQQSTNDGPYTPPQPPDAETDPRYLAIWEIFYAPTPQYPKGRYGIVNRQYQIELFRGRDPEGKERLPSLHRIYPIHELSFSQESEDFYSSSMAYRSLSAMYEYETIETKKLKLIDAIKKLLVIDGTQSADSAREQLRYGDVFEVIARQGLTQGQIENIDIDFNLTSFHTAAFEALGRFNAIFSVAGDLVSPQQGEQIATELRLRSQGGIKEANDIKKLINEAAIGVAWDLLVLSRNLSYDTQVNITRRMDRTFKQSTEASLVKGKFDVSIETSLVLDMTVGDKINAGHIVMTDMLQASALPENAGRYNLAPVLTQMFKDLGYNVSELDRGENHNKTQMEEIADIMAGGQAQVQPFDNHLKHLTDAKKWISKTQVMIMQADESPDVEISFNEIAFQEVTKHAQMHEMIIQVQSEGTMGSAWAQIQNLTNNAREAGDQPSSLGAGRVGDGTNS